MTLTFKIGDGVPNGFFKRGRRPTHPSSTTPLVTTTNNYAPPPPRNVNCDI